MIKANKLYKQIFSMILSLLIIFTGTTVCSAAVKPENEISPYYVNIDGKSANISISGIKANCTATLRSKNSVLLKIKMELQKEKSNGYETVETWTSNKTGTYLTMSESRNINVLCDYRLKVTFTAGNETEVVYRYN